MTEPCRIVGGLASAVGLGQLAAPRDDASSHEVSAGTFLGLAVLAAMLLQQGEFGIDLPFRAWINNGSHGAMIADRAGLASSERFFHNLGLSCGEVGESGAGWRERGGVVVGNASRGMLLERFDQFIEIGCCGLPHLLNVNDPIIVGDDVAHSPHAAEWQIREKRLCLRRNPAGGFANDLETAQYGVLFLDIGDECLPVDPVKIGTDRQSGIEDVA